MAFQLFVPLFQKVDTTTAQFVTNISSRVIAEMTPFITSAMSLSVVIYGILILRGAVDTPIPEFISQCFRKGIILSIALAGGLYQTNIANIITETPDLLAQSIITNATTGDTAASLVDSAAGEGFSKASQAFEKGGFLSSDGLIYGLFGMLILLTTAILTSIGGAFILLAKIALSLLAGLGPFFIFALLFQSTSRFFELWTSQVLNYALTIILFSAVFSFIMQIFGNYMSDLQFDGAQNVAYALGGSTILACASVLILLQLPSIASGLSGGVGLSYIWELHTVRSGASAFTRGASRALRMGGRIFTGGSKSGGAQSNGSQTDGSPKKTPAGYFKGGSSQPNSFSSNTASSGSSAGGPTPPKSGVANASSSVNNNSSAQRNASSNTASSSSSAGGPTPPRSNKNSSNRGA